MDRTAPTTYPIHDLLTKRWSPRAFADRPVEPDKLLRLLEAARWAPSSYNEQPWAFLVATKDRPEDFQKMLGCLIEFNRSWASAAPVLLLAAARLAFDRNGQPNRHAYYDLGQAVACLTIQATEDGLGVHQMAGILPDHARQVLAIPDGWDAVAAIAVGYPGSPESLPEQLRQREMAPRTRKPLADFVFEGGWGKKPEGI